MELTVRTADTEKIFERIVGTIPAPVQYGKALFLANGVAEPEYMSTPEKYTQAFHTYLAKCAIHNIRPFTTRTMRFVSHFNAYESGDEKSNIYRDCAPDIKDMALDMLLRGGRTNMIEVDMGHHSHGKEGFEAFRESLFPRLREAGYRVQSGELTLATVTIPGSGMYTDGTVRVDEEGASLNIGSSLDPSKKSVLVDWFRELKKKIEKK